MGCFWSCEDSIRCQQCTRKAVNELVIIDGVCEICLSRASRTRPLQKSIQRSFEFGEFRCSSCGHQWESRRAWRNKYQICKRCRKHNRPHTTRKLRPGDMSRDRENVQEHPKELCQMCIELNDYCGNYGKMRF